MSKQLYSLLVFILHESLILYTSKVTKICDRLDWFKSETSQNLHLLSFSATMEASPPLVVEENDREGSNAIVTEERPRAVNPLKQRKAPPPWQQKAGSSADQ